MLEPKTVLLNYNVTTHPSPLQAGTIGEVTLSFYASKEEVLCKQVSYAFDYGDAPGNVFVDAPTLTNVSPTDSGWTVSDNSPIDELNTRTFEINNENLGAKVQGAVSMTFQGTINATKAQGIIHVKEVSALSAGGRPHFEPKSGSLSVPRPASPNFQINSFVANDSSTEGHVVTEFDNGQEFDLSWSAQGAVSYQVFQGNNPAAIYTGTDTKCQVAAGISRATTFTLVATSADKQTQLRSLTIQVTNPDLTPRTTQIDAKDQSGDTFSASGYELSMTGSSFELDAPATLKNTLDVKGSTNLLDLNVTNIFQSPGANAMGGLDAQKITVTDFSQEETGGNGAFAAVGPVAMMGDLQLLFDSNSEPPKSSVSFPFLVEVNTPPTQCTPPTDGFVTLVLNTDMYGTGYISVGKVEVAGKVFRIPELFNDHSGNSRIFTIPVKKDEAFTYSGSVYWQLIESAKPLSQFQVYWRPLGNQPISESDLVTIAEAEVFEPDVFEESVEEIVEETIAGADKLEWMVEALHQIEDTQESRERLRKLLSALL